MVVLAGGAYAFGYFSAGENVPSNTTVNGVAVGGVPATTAETLLREGIQAKAEAPITLVAGSKKATIVPSDAGLTVDYAGTIAQAGAGRSLAPAHIWRVLAGGGSLDAVLKVDEAALTSAVATAAETFEAAGKDATLKLDGTKVVTTESIQASSLDQAAAVDAVRSAWMTTTTVDAPVVATDPAITTAEVTAVVDKTLKPALAGDIELTTDKGTLTLDLEMIAAATTITTKDGDVTAATSTEKLWEAVQDELEDHDFTPAKNASWRLVNGKPQVVPSVDGTSVSKDEFSEKVAVLLTSTTARTAKLATVKAPATLTTAKAAKLGVKEVTGEFTTYFPYAEYRNNNLSRAAASINNTFLEPGEIFSLNDTLGQRTAANGYIDGWVIQGNQLQKEVGGGVSQSATTTFNAVSYTHLTLPTSDLV